jgi:transporter family-2 protein
MKAGIIATVLAILAGAIVPVQVGVNAVLDQQLKSPFFTSFIVFLVGAVGIFISFFFTEESFPTGATIKGTTWWAWLGGLLGAIYILSLIILSQYINIGLLTILALAGQLVMAMVVDHFGWFGSTVNPISYLKILGLILIGLGIFLIKKY